MNNEERERKMSLDPASAEFFEKAFLELLPVAMQVQGWRLDWKEVRTGKERVELASHWALCACRERLNTLYPEPQEDDE